MSNELEKRPGTIILVVAVLVGFFAYEYAASSARQRRRDEMENLRQLHFELSQQIKSLEGEIDKMGRPDWPSNRVGVDIQLSAVRRKQQELSDALKK